LVTANFISTIFKHVSTITSQKVNARLRNGNILIRPPKKVKTHPAAGKLMLTVFGTHKGYYWKT